MEDVKEFRRRLEKLLKDAGKRLALSDETIAYILLQQGTAYYFKTLGKCGRCREKKK